jgi:ribosomal protein S18 acetylase RimI-like enzyme
MPEIEIRPATAEDIPHLLELEHNYTSEYVWTMDTQPTISLQGNIEPGIQVIFRQIRYPRMMKVDYPRPVYALSTDWMERSGLLAATLAGEPIGYVSLTLNFSPGKAWITDLVVRRRLHRQGIGTALVIAAMEWATNHECRSLVAEMQPKNYPAIKLLEKLGFEFSGYMDQYFQNGEIGLFFTKQL